jgi:hypothetical protein
MGDPHPEKPELGQPPRLMYSGSADGTAKCWVTEFGDCTREYKSHKGSVIAMKFHQGISKQHGMACVLAVLHVVDIPSPSTSSMDRMWRLHRSCL